MDVGWGYPTEQMSLDTTQNQKTNPFDHTLLSYFLTLVGGRRYPARLLGLQLSTVTEPVLVGTLDIVGTVV